MGDTEHVEVAHAGRRLPDQVARAQLGHGAEIGEEVDQVAVAQSDHEVVVAVGDERRLQQGDEVVVRCDGQAVQSCFFCCCRR